MEGPYRELGHGFARLSGREGVRRVPPRITCVEDALFELLRNARDAGARNVYVASTLRRRRYRILTVIDDGEGIPASYTDRVFEPGVTTRHLRPALSHADEPPHGAGLSLYHLKELSESAEFLSASNPTSVRAAFDTSKLPETSLQSGTRPSRSNIPATLDALALLQNSPTIYHATPSRILSTLLKNHIIPPVSNVNRPDADKPGSASRVREEAKRLGLQVSGRTVQRVLRGSVDPAMPVEVRGSSENGEGSWSSSRRERESARDLPELVLNQEELAAVDQIIQQAAHSRYLEASHVMEGTQVSQPGRLFIEVELNFPEEEYE
ncbi:MAG: ATP-binding protein [Rubrobacter sp.]|nr:ATP-binding protein [Rubrobacter sp.]